MSDQIEINLTHDITPLIRFILRCRSPTSVLCPLSTGFRRPISAFSFSPSLPEPLALWPGRPTSRRRSCLNPPTALRILASDERRRHNSSRTQGPELWDDTLLGRRPAHVRYEGGRLSADRVGGHLERRRRIGGAHSCGHLRRLQPQTVLQAGG